MFRISISSFITSLLLRFPAAILRGVTGKEASEVDSSMLYNSNVSVGSGTFSNYRTGKICMHTC